MKDLHFDVVAAEDHFARLGNIIVAKTIVKRHDPSFKHVADRPDHLEHFVHRDHLFEIVIKKDLRTAGTFAMVDYVLPVRESNFRRNTFAVDSSMDEFAPVVEVDGIYVVTGHAKLYIPLRRNFQVAQKAKSCRGSLEGKKFTCTYK